MFPVLCYPVVLALEVTSYLQIFVKEIAWINFRYVDRSCRCDRILPPHSRAGRSALISPPLQHDTTPPRSFTETALLVTRLIYAFLRT
jgi:hypothetical protein